MKMLRKNPLVSLIVISAMVCCFLAAPARVMADDPLKEAMKAEEEYQEIWSNVVYGGIR